MKSSYPFFVILLTALLLGNCTIEKRLHQPGWHVEWRKELPASARETAEMKHASGDEPASEIRPDAQVIREEAIALPQTIVTQENGLSTSLAVPQDVILPAAVAYSEAEPADDTIKRKVVVIDEHELQEKRSVSAATAPRDPMTIALWILCALSLLAIGACVLLLFVGTGELFILGFLFAEVPFLLLARTILALLIRRRERRHPDMYRRSENVVLAVLLPEVFMVFAFLLLILVVIALA